MQEAQWIPPVGEWPYDRSVEELAPDGPPSFPFRDFVLKLHSRCDLACDYCYVYRAVDQGWRDQPRVMSPAVIDWTARRIAEHSRTHGLSRIGVALHGGEPLLAGPEVITRTVSAIRQAVDPGVRVAVTVQTNAMRLTPRYLDLFAELDVGVSVSIDGDRTAHDRHRRRPDGRGSHATVTAALHRLTEGAYRSLFAGLLCTVDLRNDPVDTYRALLRHRPPGVDFLLPHGNWSAPPPHRVPGDRRTPYADWLIAIFDHWYRAPVRETRVRQLDEIVTLLLGGRARVEGLGLAPVGYVVVETNGAIAHDDTLKTAYPGATGTGLHVASHPFDLALRQHFVVARQLGVAALSAECRGCSLRRVCGGGHYSHRYRAGGTGFANPSVYCPDLTALIHHVRDRLTEDVGRLAGERGPGRPDPGRA